MNKLKFLLYALVIVVLILIAFTMYSGIYQSTSSSEEPATITSQALIELENYSIVHLIISNNEGVDVNYTICTSTDNFTRCFDQPIGNEKMFTYKHHVRPEENQEKEVNVVIYKESELIENITYHVSKPSR